MRKCVASGKGDAVDNEIGGVFGKRGVDIMRDVFSQTHVRRLRCQLRIARLLLDLLMLVLLIGQRRCGPGLRRNTGARKEMERIYSHCYIPVEK